jgi:peptide/nickel transport system substrate-binding protein
VHAQKKGGTLRFVPHADLKILDPIWTTAYITRNHGYMIFDTLFALDESLKLQPQMVDKYTVSKDDMKYSFTLRDGLKFHDGAPVTAEDCVASLKRWGAKDAVGRLMMPACRRWRPSTRRRSSSSWRRRSAWCSTRSAGPRPARRCIMPARLAATTANEQVKEVIGSGRSRSPRMSGQHGQRVVYIRNPELCAAQGNAERRPPGASRPLVDRVEWRYIPDPASGRAALEPARWITGRTCRTISRRGLEKNPNHQRVRPPTQGQPRASCAPITCTRRSTTRRRDQALLLAVDQKNYMQAVIGNENTTGLPPACSCAACRTRRRRGRRSPTSSAPGSCFKESGYDGRPLVVLDPTDTPYAHAARS